MHYVPNNINFRITSSHVVSKFKSDQSFDLNEVVNSKNYRFTKESREFLLLNYDIWSKCVMRLERICITHHDASGLSKSFLNTVNHIIDTAFSDINDIVISNHFLFNNEQFAIIKQVEDYHREVLDRTVDHCVGKTIYYAFPKIVSVISASLHNILFQLQEIEILMSDEQEKIINLSDDFDNALSAKTDYKLLVEKIKVYMDKFGIKTFVLKNYSDIDPHFTERLIKDIESDTQADIKRIENCL